MPAYAILRVKKLKSWGAIAGADAHNFRQRETPNADDERRQDNIVLTGDPEKDSVEAAREAIGEQKIRKNAVLGVEIFLGASPEYFKANGENADEPAPERLQAWVQASDSWLQEKYGDRIIKSVVHMDETTPHIHAVLVPLDETGKLNCRKLFGGTKHTMSELQTDYAKAVEKLGLERGAQGSRATHQEVSKFYAALQTAEAQKIPRAQSVDIPPLPGKVERLADSNLTHFAQKVAASAITEQQSTTKPIIQALAGENALLKKQAEELRRANATLSQDREQLRQQANMVRGLALPAVLTKLYGAREGKYSRENHQSRKFELPDGTKIATTGDLWHDNTNNTGKKGAINLVMHLSGYGQNQYGQAVRELAEAFGTTQTQREVTRHMKDGIPEQAAKITEQAVNAAFKMPEPCPDTWRRVRSYLVEQRKLPEKLVDIVHEGGLVYSDRRGNCVFPCDKNSGAFQRGTGPQPFKRTTGQGHLPYVLPGTDKRVIVTESAIDALSLKTKFPISSVLATGGNIPIDRLKPYLEGKEIYLAHDNDRAGEAQASRIQAAYPEAQRLMPPHGTDWNESLQKEREIEISRHQQRDMER